jgi:hypothetical protein
VVKVREKVKTQEKQGVKNELKPGKLDVLLQS